ncbi:MAG: C40 family peptidase [bacterium]|nr:C40 family peptidase [bacterium]
MIGLKGPETHGKLVVFQRMNFLGIRWLMGLTPVLFLALVFSGCAPKRVVNGEFSDHSKSDNSSVSSPKKTDTGKEDFPEPQARGKINSQPTKNTIVNPSKFGPQVVGLAKKQLNKPYQWGAQGPDKFDCSGLVYYIYGTLDISLPRVSKDQAKFGQQINKGDLQPGDLVFFVTSGKVINHVGIYMGDSRFIHAPRRYSPVRYDSLNNSWWRRRFKFGRRIQG